MISAALRALVAFSRLAQPKQADIDQVMRTLAEHDDWFVPTLYAERAWGQTVFDRRLTFGDAAPSPLLNVFTDLASAGLAKRQAIGVYGGPVSGVQLLRSLGTDVSALIVNPASPREQQWYIATGGFEIAARWANVIAVEHALADRGNGVVPTVELLMHRYQLLLDKPTRAVAEIHLPDIDGVVAVCFTAMDRFEEFIACLPLAARPLAEVVEVPGTEMFHMLQRNGAAGIVINAGSDDQTALTREDILEIAE